jgi:hypothetical protein
VVVRHILCGIAIAAVFLARDVSLAQPPAPAAATKAPLLSLRDPVEKRLYDDVAYLASDELGGRGPYSQGLELASQHIANRWREIGLATKLYGETPFHVFASKSNVALGPTNSLAVTLPGESEQQRTLGIDFTPLSLTARGQFSGEVVFAGFGIAASDWGYDDFTEIDVQNKAVIVLRHHPMASDPKHPFATKGATPHSFLAAKCEAAASRGASAIVIVSDEEHAAWLPATPTETDQLEREKLLAFQIETQVRTNSQAKPILVLHVSRKECDRWLAACRRPALTELEDEINRTIEPKSFLLEGLQVGIETSLAVRKTTLKNVIGVIPGSGKLAAEVVVVGAHYDHLGLGGSGSLAPWTVAPHNGADDNASGTAALMETARQIAERRRQSGAPLDCRTLVFIAFSAEEMGLVGSARYVRAPLFPLDKTVAMVNLDMVGRLRKKLIVSGTGTAKEFTPMIRQLAKTHTLDVVLDPSGYGPSDHASFYERGIPVLHFFTGLHGDYHRPSDDTQTLNYPGMRKVVGITVDTVMQLAQSPERPIKTSVQGEMNLLGGLELDGSEKGESRRGNSSVSTSPARSSRPGLGIQVQLVDGNKVRIEQVTLKSPAAAGQLRPGDIIVKADGREVDGVESLRGAVIAHRLGETMMLLVRRDDVELELPIKLENPQ